MKKEIRLGDYEQRDKDGYVRIHGYELGQLIKQANGSYNMLKDLNYLQRDRNRWRSVAEVLAREMGTPVFAYAEYENQKGVWE